jgi:hypothetical protein
VLERKQGILVIVRAGEGDDCDPGAEVAHAWISIS